MRYEKLLEPSKREPEIDIAQFDAEVAETLLRKLIFIRCVENWLANMKKIGEIGGPVHLGVGQEAIAAGVSCHLTKDDKVFGAHRSHAHLLALNPNAHKLFAEVLGKSTGFSRGMGGSMHLWDQTSGFYGSVPIVSGTVPLAVGAGFASKLNEDGTLAACYLGDGAIEEGVVHESLNLASKFKLPVIFVLENNLFASHMHISQRQPKPLTSRFAIANEIPFEVVDGNDIGAIEKATNRAAKRARKGSGPSFIEAITFRWYGHVDWREDIDVGVNRSIKDIKAWKLLDPISRLENAMIKRDGWTQTKTASHTDDVKIAVAAAWEQAKSDPYPAEETLLNAVFFEHVD